MLSRTLVIVSWNGWMAGYIGGMMDEWDGQKSDESGMRAGTEI